MHEQTIRNLEQLAQDDPDVGLLALLYRDTVSALDETSRDAPAISIDATRLTHGIPALDGQRLSVDAGAFIRLLRQMIETGSLEQAWPDARRRVASLDVPRFVRAIIAWDAATIDQIAEELDAPPALLLTLGGTAVVPVLVPLQQAIFEQASDVPWDAGYCPVCGTWPALAEQRGLEKQLWLRCGRCAAAWRTQHQRCSFCNNTDFRKLGYMAAEDKRESRRVTNCFECHSYIKTLATVSPLSAGEVLRRDLESLELDVAATDAGYSRPEQPGFQVLTEVDATAKPGRTWFPW